MNLSYFTSYFEILVGLNLGYAAFDYFRKELANRIFKSHKVSDVLLSLYSRLESQISEAKENQELYNQLIHIKETVDIQADILDNREEKGRSFFEILKPISLVLALFSISFLVLAGFQDQVIPLEKKTFFSDYIFRLSCFIAIFCFSIFYRSFSRRALEYIVKTTPVEIIIVFIIFSTISCDFIFNFIFPSIIWQAIGLLLFPIFVSAIISIFDVIRVKKYAERNWTLLAKNSLAFIWKNRLTVLLYLGLIMVAYLPVVIWFIEPTNNFIQYLIILTTPLLLFAFLSIRVWVHKRKFSKKYGSLSRDHVSALNILLSKR